MTYTLTMYPRVNMGKRSRDEQAARRIPAVIYGRGVDSQPISVPRHDFLSIFKNAGYSSLVDMTMEGVGPVKAIIKEVQFDPLTLEPRHIDFHQVRMDEEMTTDVPLKFVGDAPAVKVGGGTLVKSLDQIQIRCLPTKLPHEIEVDISALETFDDALTIGKLHLPEGVTAVTEGEVIIATVARPFTEDELKKMEEGEIGDVTAVKSQADEERAAKEAAEAAEAAAKE